MKMHFPSPNEKKLNDETLCAVSFFFLFLTNYIRAVVNSLRFNVRRTKDTLGFQLTMLLPSCAALTCDRMSPL